MNFNDEDEFMAGAYSLSPDIFVFKSYLRRILDLSSLYAPLKTSLILTRGTGNPTFTRASVATFTDWERVNTSPISGEARFSGARRVYNLIPAAGSGSASLAIAANKTVTVGAGTFVFSMGLGASSGVCTFTGTATGSTGTLTQNTTNRTSRTLTITVGGTIIMTASVATLIDLQLENVTGQSNQNPSEYVSVGVLSAPFHGAGVDGVKSFSTQNGNTVASNVVTEGVGATLATGQSNYAVLTGAASSYFSTPDSVTNSFTGDIDVRVALTLADWTPTVSNMFMAKSNAAYTDRSWSFYINVTGTLVVSTSANGTTWKFSNQASTAPVSFADGTSGFVRFTVDVDNGAAGCTLTFYTSLNGVSWTILGTAITLAGTTSIFDSAASLLVGNSPDLGAPLNGKITRAQVYNGIDGTLAVDFNPNSYTSGTTWASATGETWTINGAVSVDTGAGRFSAGGPLGYLAEPAATQLVTPTASIRGLTNAAWTKTNMTTALTSVGADGVASSATRCTATAANATCLQTLVAAASSRTVGLLVRRITGTGAFELTQNNAAFTAVTTTALYTLVSLNASVLDASFGFRIVTSGDAFDVDMVQFEAGAVATSRMLTAGLSRPIDVDSYTNPLNTNNISLYLEYTPEAAAASLGTVFLWASYVDASNYTAILYDGTNVIFRKRIAGVNTDATKALAMVAGTTYKLGTRASSATGQDVFVNGVIGTNNANTTACQMAATLQIGTDGNGANSATGNIRNDLGWNRSLTDAEQALLASSTF